MIPERKAEVYFLIENIERQKTESIHCHHSTRWSIPLTANTKIKPNIKPISIPALAFTRPSFTYKRSIWTSWGKAYPGRQLQI